MLPLHPSQGDALNDVFLEEEERDDDGKDGNKGTSILGSKVPFIFGSKGGETNGQGVHVGLSENNQGPEQAIPVGQELE